MDHRPILLALLAGLGGCGGTLTAVETDDTSPPAKERGCIAAPGDGTCPPPGEVDPDDVTPLTCGATVVSVDGAGVVVDGCIDSPEPACEYNITVIPPEIPCDYGRPYVVDGTPRLADTAAGAAWAPSFDGAPSVDVAALDPATRRAAGARWLAIGRAEHASVASFARVVLDLLALGAPPTLVRDALAAAQDEIAHAELAFGLAAAFAGAPRSPGPLPAPGPGAADLAAFAVATAREGCVAETLSALRMAEARDAEADPAVRAVLARIVDDETRHAALAWRTVRWAIAAGGAPVRDAVAEALAAPADPPRGWAELIVPATDALLGRSAGRSTPRAVDIG